MVKSPSSVQVMTISSALLGLGPLPWQVHMSSFKGTNRGYGR